MPTQRETLLIRLQKLLGDRRTRELLSMILGVFIVLGAVMGMLVLLEMPREILRSDSGPKAEDVLLQDLSSAYDRGMVTNLEEVRRIKEILTVEYPALTDVDLSAVLKRWLLKILRESDSTDSEQVKATYGFVNMLFDREESERPFSILPDKAQVVATKLKESIVNRPGFSGGYVT